MKIETYCDLVSAWDVCTTPLGKIMIFPFMLVGWIGLFLVSCFLTATVEIGQWSRLMDIDEPEEDEETDIGNPEMGEE
jgi:hypothetical protein